MKMRAISMKLGVSLSQQLRRVRRFEGCTDVNVRNYNPEAIGQWRL